MRRELEQLVRDLLASLERAQRKAREKLDELRVEAGYDPEGEPDIEDLLRYVEVLEAEVGGGVIARHG